jgi:hypothetical protein
MTTDYFGEKRDIVEEIRTIISRRPFIAVLGYL